MVTAAGAFVATVPAYLQLQAEWRVSIDERVEEMRLLRAAAREPATGSGPARPRSAVPASAPK